MKIQITFKTPDAVERALDDLFEENDDTDEDARDRHQMEEALEKFIRYGELVTVEFDTEAGTAVVLETRK